MPLYDYRCDDCLSVEEHYAKIDELTHECERCGGVSKRVLTSSYYVVGDIDFVTDNVSGEPKRYTSRRALEAELKERGLTQKVGKGWW